MHILAFAYTHKLTRRVKFDPPYSIALRPKPLMSLWISTTYIILVVQAVSAQDDPSFTETAVGAVVPRFACSFGALSFTREALPVFVLDIGHSRQTVHPLSALLRPF